MTNRTLHLCSLKVFFCLKQRYSLVLLLLAMLKFVHSQANASPLQDSLLLTMSLTNATLERAFAVIKQQTPYRVIYDNSLLKKAKPVTVLVEKEPLSNVLPLLFSSQPFEYRIIDQSIILTPRQSKTGTAYYEASKLTPPAEDTLITGFVMADSSLLPLSGASIQVKGTNIAATADNAGRFQIRIPQQNAILIISYVEYSTKNIQVNKNTQFPLNVFLNKTSGEMGEISIVSTGYELLPKERATGSFEKVDNQLFNRSVTTNVLERLDGIVPGLIFNRRIGTDNQIDISIRGISTLNSDMRPLIVVDNFPYNGDISNLNPNDVESITVLKDAAAASIWGAKAGNGVIVITTKKGKYNERMNLTVNSNITVINRPDLYYVPRFSSSDFINVEKYLFDNEFYDAQLSNDITYPIISPVIEILNKERNSWISQEQAKKLIEEMKQFDIREDYLKYLYRKGISQQYSINLSGGNNNINYNFSVGHDRNLSSLIGNEYERITIRSFTGLMPVKNLSIQIGMQLTSSNSSNNSLGTAIIPESKSQIYPYARLVDKNGNHLAIEKNYQLSFIDTAGNGNLLDWKYKPLDELQNSDKTSKLQSALLNINIKYKVSNSISSEILYQHERQTVNGRNNYNLESFYTRNLINIYTPTGGNAKVNSAIPYGGILQRNSSELSSHSLRGQLSFSKKINDVHELKVLVGSEIRQIERESNSGVIYGYDDEILSSTNVDLARTFPTYKNLLGTSARIPGGTYLSENLDRFVSFYANAAYSYKKKYSLSLSGRRDASNLFGVSTNNKWKPLWSVGGAWTVSNEQFYKSKLVPYLRLRTTYGFSGNVNNSVAGVLTLATMPNNSLVSLPALGVNNPPNPNLRWENVGITNFGIDFQLDKDKISGSIEYYLKKSTDLITSTNYDLTSGFSLLTANSAILNGQGVDINIYTKNTDDLIKWGTNFQFAFNNNKVSKYLLKKSIVALNISDGALNPIEGQNAFSILSWKYMGLDPLTGDPLGFIDNKVTSNYDSIFKVSTIFDMVNHGSARPLYFGAIRNTFSWKEISVSFNITYRLSYYFRRQNLINYNALFDIWDQKGYADYLKRWQKPGDEQHTNIPSMIYPANSDRDNFYSKSEITVERGDHIRFQDINFNYSINKSRLQKMPFKTIDFYLYLNNISFIWRANKAGLDPDYETPLPFTFSLGIKAAF